MCLYPRLIKNKKYVPTKKNNYNPPPIAEYDEKGNIIKNLVDPRLLYVAVGCGNCIECRKQKAREWRVRLQEELKCNKYAYFITFTFNNGELEKLCTTYNLSESNAVAGKAVRLYLERWRKVHKKSQKHWFITELGHEGTERIHLHGIVFSDFEITKEYFEKFWNYGYIWIGDYCSQRTINYIIKYVTKLDTDHKNFKAQIFCSKGIGAGYLKSRFTQHLHRFNGEYTIEHYRLSNGAKIALPTYYRNKVFSEQEREQLWIQQIEKGVRYVMGVEIDHFETDEGQARYWRVLRKMREHNAAMGYGDDSGQWKKEDYNVTIRMLNKKRNKR